MHTLLMWKKKERICSRYKRLENKAICTVRNKINEVENFGQILHSNVRLVHDKP